jgi:hypothetical protein
VQLTPKGSIRSALTAATAALLGGSAAHAAGDNRVESTLLLYSEVHRVQAAEGMLGLTRALPGNRVFSARFTFDALTGASPNGATPSRSIQTFTRPSGSSSYAVKPGETPLDNTFKDTRLGVDGTLTQPLGRLTSALAGAHISAEHDYTSVGANVGLTRDLFRKNTTLAASVALTHDIVSPLGGVPTPLTPMAAPTDGGGDVGEEDGRGSGPGEGKNLVDMVLGLTQVLSRRTIVRFNYSYSHANGYLTDPYKLLSVVQGPADTRPGEPVDYVYESRPKQRDKRAVYGEVRQYLGGHTIDVSYRYFWDDWGITSKTVDLFYRLPLPAGHALLPHVRWYRQTGADFFRSYLLNGAALPTSVSADSRLAPFHALTVGLQYALPVAPDTHVDFGAEYYHQAGDLSPPSSMGILSDHELFPRMNAVMVRVGFNRDF